MPAIAESAQAVKEGEKSRDKFLSLRPGIGLCSKHSFALLRFLKMVARLGAFWLSVWEILQAGKGVRNSLRLESY